MEVTHNKILICLLLIKIIRNFEVIELPLNIVQLNLYLAKYVFLHNGKQLEGEKCKFQKLQNKDHPNLLVLASGGDTWLTWSRTVSYTSFGLHKTRNSRHTAVKYI